MSHEYSTHVKDLILITKNPAKLYVYLLRELLTKEVDYEQSVDDYTKLLDQFADLARDFVEAQGQIGDLTNKNNMLTGVNTQLAKNVADLTNNVASLTAANEDLHTRLGDPVIPDETLVEPATPQLLLEQPVANFGNVEVVPAIDPAQPTT